MNILSISRFGFEDCPDGGAADLQAGHVRPQDAARCWKAACPGRPGRRTPTVVNVGRRFRAVRAPSPLCLMHPRIARARERGYWDPFQGAVLPATPRLRGFRGSGFRVEALVAR
ncbi:unnamed protein product [Symbiodinium sp. CCMP2592]|nr:unnamed protein product [Symbiodinium sp. CCMP2592]